MRTWIAAVVMLVCVGLVVWMLMDGPDDARPGEEKASARPIPKTEAAPPRPPSPPSPPSPHPPVAENTAAPAVVASDAPEDASSRLTGPGRITGEAMDISGAVVAGAEVALWEYSWEKTRVGEMGDLLDTVTTDAQGRFVFAELPLLMYRVKVTKESQMGAGFANLRDAPTSAHVIVVLQACGTFSGTVVDAEGQGIAGAIVTAAGRKGEQYSSLSSFMRGETDGEGAFSILHLPKGDWRFQVTADGYAHCVTDYFAYDTQGARFVLTKGGSLTGHAVMADSKEPVSGLTVMATTTLSGSSPDVSRAETGADGVFRFDTLRAGDYSLSPDDDTLVLAAGQPPRISVVDGQEASGVTLEMIAGGVITGRAFDAVSGTGVSGIKINIYPAAGGTYMRRTDIRTDADGRYRSPGLSGGTYRIMRTGVKGYVSKGTNWNDAPLATVTVGQDTTLDFSLDPAPTLSGIVQDKNGKGVSGAYVRAWIEGNNNNVQAESISEPDGRFEIAGFPAGDTVSLRAKTEMLVSDVMPGVAIAEGGVSDLVLVLGKSLDGKISGTVVDSRGQGVANAMVYGQMSAGRQLSMVNCWANTDADGRFLIAGLPVDSYTMEVRPPNSYQRGQQDANKTVIKLSEGEHRRDVRLVISDEAGLSISGRVTAKGGAPVSGASVNAQGGGSYGYTQTDADGDYEITGITEGAYRVYVRHNDYTDTSREDVAAGSRNVHFQLDPCGAIEGQVVDAATGQPVVDFQVAAIKGPQEVFTSWMKQRLTSIHNIEGQFSLPRVQGGETTLAVCASGFASTLTAVGTVRPGETVRNVRIALESGASASGIVIDSDGQPISGAQIFIGNAPNEYRRAGEAVATSAADGTFEVNSLSVSDTRLSAYYPGYSQGSATISPQPGRTVNVEIVLRIGARIEGTVSIGGEPAAGANVNAQLLSLFNNGASAHSNAGSDGHYVLEGLTVGECMVTAQIPTPDRPDTWRRIKRPAIVASGQVTVVDLDFPPASCFVDGVMTIAGAPVTEGYVNATVTTTESEETCNARVEGRDGYYRLGPFPAGHVAASFSTQGRRKVVEFDIRDGETVRQDVSFLTPASISGVVRGLVPGAEQVVAAVSGEVQVPAVISLLSLMAYERYVVADTQIAPDGSYTLANLEPGSYTIAVISLPTNVLLARYALVRVTVDEGDQTTLDLDLVPPRAPIVVPGEE